MKLIEFLPKIVKLIRKYPDKEITITSFPEELSSDDELLINISGYTISKYKFEDSVFTFNTNELQSYNFGTWVYPNS